MNRHSCMCFFSYSELSLFSRASSYTSVPSSQSLALLKLNTVYYYNITDFSAAGSCPYPLLAACYDHFPCRYVLRRVGCFTDACCVGSDLLSHVGPIFTDPEGSLCIIREAVFGRICCDLFVRRSQMFIWTGISCISDWDVWVVICSRQHAGVARC